MTDAPTNRFRIGQVRDLLIDEFPDLTISKLRFLEDQGLVTPQRSGGGYRLFTPEDVAKLRGVLRMQRDEFLPLKVIREQIRRQVERPTAQRRAEPAVPAVDVAPAESGLDQHALARAAGVDVSVVGECREYGLIGNGADGYDDADVAVVSGVARMARYGLGVRHLRQTAAATRGQAALVGSYAVARARRGAGGEEARTHAASLADDLLGLVRSLFIREARRQLTADSPRPGGIVQAAAHGHAGAEEHR